MNDRAMPDISLQQMIAVMLIDGTVGFRAAHDETRMRDPATVKARAKVRLVPDAVLEPFYPRLVAIVEVTLRDGSKWSEHIDKVRGTAQNQMSHEEVVAKARDMMLPLLGPARTSRVIDAVLSLEQMRDVRELRLLLRIQGSA